MDAKIIEKEIGPEAKLKVAFEEGQLKISVEYQGKLGGAGLSITADAYQVIDAITDAIPGEMDDTFIDPLAEKMLAKKKA